MTTTDLEIADHHAAGALADELPYWGWLPDERTCLTRRGELVTLARLTPTVVDGHTPEQLDAVLNRWQRMLSGIDARTRIYFYLLRRPATFPAADTGLSAVADLGQRKRRAFLASRIQQIETYLAWCYDPPPFYSGDRPEQSTVVETLRADVDETPAESERSDLLPRTDRGRGGALSATGRRQPYARRRPHTAGDSVGTRRLPPTRRAGEQARPSTVGWGDRQRLELAAGPQRTRSGAATPAARRRARDSLLALVPAGQGHGESPQ